MGPDFVVTVAPDGQLPAGIGQAVEQFLVEQFIAQRAVEGLDEPILPALARVDVMPLDLVLASPFRNRPTGELGAVIADNASRFAIEPHQRIKLSIMSIVDARFRKRHGGFGVESCPSCVIDWTSILVHIRPDQAKISGGRAGGIIGEVRKHCRLRKTR